MPNSVPRLTGLDYSASPLRAETARLMAAACEGIGKMVAAALSVGRSRVDRMNEGQDANYLELLARQLDRIEKEEGAERIKPALRWLAARYGYTLGAVAAQPTTGEEVERSVAIAIRTASDACAKTIEAAVDGIQEDERPDVTLALRRSIEALTDTLNKIESAPTAKPRLRTAGALTFGHQS